MVEGSRRGIRRGIRSAKRLEAVEGLWRGHGGGAAPTACHHARGDLQLLAQGWEGGTEAQAVFPSRWLLGYYPDKKGSSPTSLFGGLPRKTGSHPRKNGESPRKKGSSPNIFFGGYPEEWWASP